MSFFRVEKNGNYTVMSNYHLRDKSLSLQAKGLLSVILSLPDGWDFSKSGLLTLIGETEYTLDKVLNELKEHLYLSIVKVKPADGKQRITWEYRIYESPAQNATPTPPKKRPEKKSKTANSLYPEIQGIENQDEKQSKTANSLYPEIQGIENQCLENQGNNKKLNKSNTERINTDKRERERDEAKQSFAPPTLDEIKEYCNSEGLTHVDPEYFYGHYKSNNWKHLFDWKVQIKKWERDDAAKTYKSNSSSRKEFDERDVKPEEFKDFYPNVMERPPLQRGTN